MIGISTAFCLIKSLRFMFALEVKKSSAQRGSSEKKAQHKSSNPTEENQCEEPKGAHAGGLAESDIKDSIESLSSSTDADAFNSRDPEAQQLKATARELDELNQVKTKNEPSAKRASNKGIRIIILKINFTFLLWSYS